ncbi:hypothetical protein NPIL_220311, partial [Nephila pilipes]
IPTLNGLQYPSDQTRPDQCTSDSQNSEFTKTCEGRDKDSLRSLTALFLRELST